MNPEPTGTVNGYWMPTIVVDEGVSFERDAFLATLKHSNIDGRVFFWSLSALAMFEPGKFNGVSRRIFDRALNLPSIYDMNYEELDRVSSKVRQALQHEKVT